MDIFSIKTYNLDETVTNVKLFNNIWGKSPLVIKFLR